MTKERQARAAKEVTILGSVYLTVNGLREQLPGRRVGTKTGIEQILRYVKEGCPCFEQGGRFLFDPQKVKAWLETRTSQSRRKYQEKRKELEKIY